uniref:Uncharacterized protein n=1 Tax=Oryza barthii TaxID=65489 RepID=A0A0D3HT70_9ORYZ
MAPQAFRYAAPSLPTWLPTLTASSRQNCYTGYRANACPRQRQAPPHASSLSSIRTPPPGEKVKNSGARPSP